MMFQELTVRAESTLITVLPPRFVKRFRDASNARPDWLAVGVAMKTHDDNRNNRQLDSTMSCHFPSMEDHVPCIEFAW